MNITINTAEPLSEADRRILQAFLGQPATLPAPTVHSAAISEKLQAKATEAVEAGETTQAPALAAPAKARRKPAAKPAPEPEPEPEDDETPAPEEPEADEPKDDEEDLVGAAPTLDAAVARATTLVSEGRAAEVKAALAEIGAKRVSELSGKAIAQFLNAVS